MDLMEDQSLDIIRQNTNEDEEGPPTPTIPVGDSIIENSGSGQYYNNVQNSKTAKLENSKILDESGNVEDVKPFEVDMKSIEKD